MDVSHPSFAESPVFTNTDLQEWFCYRGDFTDKLRRFHRSNCFIEWDDEQILDAKRRDELLLVLNAGEQERGLFRTQHAGGMRIECYDYGSSTSSAGIHEGSLDDCAMTKVNTVKHADCEH
jgi:hypothetical protein